MADKDREIWIGESRVYLGEGNIICMAIVGDIDENTVIALWNASREMGSKVEGNARIFIDLTRAGRPSSKARRIGQQRLEDKGIGKVAILGMHPVARVIASFMMGVTRKKDMRFFRSKEKALAWLKE